MVHRHLPQQQLPHRRHLHPPRAQPHQPIVRQRLQRHQLAGEGGDDGAFGALRKLEGRLAPAFVLMAREAGSQAELKLLKTWADANGAKFVVVDRQEGFVKISRQAPAQAAATAAASKNQKMQRAY